MHTLGSQCVTIITEAAASSIPRGARTTTKPWWNEEVAEDVRCCEEAQKVANLSEDYRLRWIEQCEEARSIIDRAKT